jgi:hypothetical protein
MSNWGVRLRSATTSEAPPATSQDQAAEPASPASAGAERPATTSANGGGSTGATRSGGGNVRTFVLASDSPLLALPEEEAERSALRPPAVMLIAEGEGPSSVTTDSRQAMEGERPDVHSSVVQPMVSREPEGSPAGAPESSEDSDMPEDTGGVFSTPKKTAHVKTSPTEPSGVWSFTPHLFRQWFDPEKPADNEVSAYTSESDESPSPRGPRPLRKNERNRMTRQRRKSRRVVPQLEGGEPSSQPQTGAGGSSWQIPPVQINQGSLFKEIDKALSEDDEYRDKNYEYQVTRNWGLQKREEPQSGEAPKADESPGDPLVVCEAQGTRKPEGMAPIAKVPLPKAQESRRAGEGNRAGSPTIPAVSGQDPSPETDREGRKRQYRKATGCCNSGGIRQYIRATVSILHDWNDAAAGSSCDISDSQRSGW